MHALICLPLLLAATQDTVTLREAMRAAAYRSPNAIESGARVAQARAGTKQARSVLLPQVEGTAQYGTRTFNSETFGLRGTSGDPVIGPIDQLDLRARATLTLLDFAALKTLQTSRSLVDASAADSADLAEANAARAAAAYLRVLRADALFEARHADSAQAAELLRIAEQQVAAGVAPQLERTRAQAHLASVLAELGATRSEQLRARSQFEQVTGLMLSSGVVLADGLDSLAADPIGEVEGDPLQVAYDARADLRALDARLRASRGSLSAAKAERLPTIQAFGDIGANGVSGDRLERTYSVGVGVTIPVFNGLGREAQIEERNAETRRLEAAHEELRRVIRSEVETALADLLALSSRLDAAREQDRLAEDEVRQAQSRLVNGVAGNADVVNALLARTRARTALTEALADRAAGQVTLRAVQGRLISSGRAA
jgi:outer membrane protein TolC